VLIEREYVAGITGMRTPAPSVVNIVGERSFVVKVVAKLLQLDPDGASR
jgi:hypothetical protein